MFGVKINGTFISLFPGTRLTFEMHHPIGIITDALDQVDGGISFPIDIPLDDTNLEIIGHAHRLDLDSTLIQDEYCEVWVEGVLLYIGKATIKEAGNARASLFMIFNDLRDLVDVSMLSLDLGGERNIGADEATRTAHADDTLANPLDHDYIFAPVYNPVYRPLWDDGFPTAQQRHFQNFWSSDDGAFAEYPVTGITPFVRLDYLLSRIFAYSGFTLDNQWQTTDELRLLLLYNNYNINTHSAPAVSSWDEVIDLVNHVPARNSLDLVKAIIATYALGLFPDPHDKTMLLIPFKTLITNPVEDDWTDRAAEIYKFTTDRDFIARWQYDIDPDDEMSVRFSGRDFPQNIVSGEGLTARAMFAAAEYGLRYSICDNTYYFIAIGTFSADYIAQDLKSVIKTGSDLSYVSPLLPLWNSHDIETDGDDNDSLPIQQQQLAAIEHTGYIKEYADAQKVCVNLRLFFYRGFQPYDTGTSGTYPMTGITRYNINGDQIGDYALTWDQTGGIYDAWWKLPYQMLRDKKQVNRTLNLSIRDLLNFRFWHKIRIENQNYFMTRFRFTVSERGISPVEATMITTL